ncbi:MAG: hypothetical protein QOD62_1346, partial [Actinomycetota bacterium]|nr:hypothetical protein [Actinomycetota bacterium]
VPSPFTEAQVWCLDDKIRWSQVDP